MGEHVEDHDPCGAPCEVLLGHGVGPPSVTDYETRTVAERGLDGRNVVFDEFLGAEVEVAADEAGLRHSVIMTLKLPPRHADQVGADECYDLPVARLVLQLSAQTFAVFVGIAGASAWVLARQLWALLAA